NFLDSATVGIDLGEHSAALDSDVQPPGRGIHSELRRLPVDGEVDHANRLRERVSLDPKNVRLVVARDPGSSLGRIEADARGPDTNRNVDSLLSFTVDDGDRSGRWVVACNVIGAGRDIDAVMELVHVESERASTGDSDVVSGGKIGIEHG